MEMEGKRRNDKVKHHHRTHMGQVSKHIYKIAGRERREGRAGRGREGQGEEVCCC